MLAAEGIFVSNMRDGLSMVEKSWSGKKRPKDTTGYGRQGFGSGRSYDKGSFASSVLLSVLQLSRFGYPIAFYGWLVRG